MVEITLIMPVYNAGECLRESLENILSQSFKDFELICVDDKSKDDSLQRLLEYSSQDNRVIVKHDEKNLMQSLNESVIQAKGKYILFTDSENLIKQDILKQVYEKTKEHQFDVLLLKSSDGNQVHEKCSKLLSLNQDKTFNHNRISELIFDIDNSVYNTVYNKEFLLKNAISFNTEVSDDCERFFYNAILKADNIAYLDRKVYRTYNHRTKKCDLEEFTEYLKTQNNIYELFNQDKYLQQAVNNKIANTIDQYSKTCMDDKKQAYTLLREDYIAFLNQNDSEKLIGMLNDDNHKYFEQIIITETVEEYELLKKVYQDKKTINYNKRYEKILKTEHKKIKMFNDSLKSSKSWKLTKLFRL